MLSCARWKACVPAALVTAALVGSLASSGPSRDGRHRHGGTVPRRHHPWGHTHIAAQQQIHPLTLPPPPPPPSPADFPYDCTPPPAATAALLEPLADPAAPPAQPVRGHGHPFPPWMASVCPEVVAHFEAIPYFSRAHARVPAMTSVQAAHMVCTVKIASAIALHAKSAVMLYAGSFIGALRHGGPVPWDDDVDLVMPHGAYSTYMEQCDAMKHAFHPDVAVFCVSNPLYGGYIKLYVQDRCGGTHPTCSPSTLISRNNTSHAWRWPFADIFLYRTANASWEESTIGGDPSGRGRSFPVKAVLPAQLYYFGGLAVPGPRAQYASLAYKWQTCVTGGYNHRDETPVQPDMASMHINCCEAATRVPFVVGTALVGGGGAGRWALPDLLRRALPTSTAQGGWERALI